MDIEYIIVIDTEFVSSKDGQQPFQIAMRSYRIDGSNLMNISNFNVFVQLREGLKLTYFAKKYSNITQEKLEELGIYPSEAIGQIINFLLNFDIKSTLIVGWDPINDRRMLDALLNHGDSLINMDSFKWFDLVVPYKQIHCPDKKDTPSLKEACETYGLIDYAYHDAEVDAYATASLLIHLLNQHGLETIISKNLQAMKKPKYIKKRA